MRSPRLFRRAHHPGPAFDRRSLQWFESSLRRAAPEGQAPSLAQHHVQRGRPPTSCRARHMLVAHERLISGTRCHRRAGRRWSAPSGTRQAWSWKRRSATERDGDWWRPTSGLPGMDRTCTSDYGAARPHCGATGSRRYAQAVQRATLVRTSDLSQWCEDAYCACVSQSASRLV
jgi:hypothetical protein